MVSYEANDLKEEKEIVAFKREKRRFAFIIAQRPTSTSHHCCQLSSFFTFTYGYASTQHELSYPQMGKARRPEP